MLARVLERLLGRGRTRPRTCASPRCSTRSTSCLEPHIFPQPRRRRRSAQLPGLRKRPAVAQARPLRRLHRLLELSRLPLHPAADAGRRTASVNGTKVLGEDPKTGLEVSLRSGRFGPYVQLGERRTRKRRPRSPSAPACPRASTPDDIDLEQRAGAAGAAARGRHPSRGRRADHGRRRPLRPLRQARQDLRQSRRPRTCSPSA